MQTKQNSYSNKQIFFLTIGNAICCLSVEGLIFIEGF